MGKLNSTGKTASKGFTDSDISHGEFNLAVNEEKILSGWKKASEQKTVY